MKLIPAIAAALTLSFSAAGAAHADNVLVVLSDSDHLDLRDGRVLQTGFYLNELMQPVQALREAGHTITFATPRGAAPTLDRSSVDKIAARLQGADLTDQIEGPVLATREILDEAHDEAVLGRRLGDHGRYLSLAERDVGLQPALAADQVVASVLARADRNRLLETQVGDAGDQFVEDAPVTDTRIENGDGRHRYGADLRDSRGHAALLRVARPVSSKKRSRSSNR